MRWSRNSRSSKTMELPPVPDDSTDEYEDPDGAFEDEDDTGEVDAEMPEPFDG